MKRSAFVLLMVIILSSAPAFAGSPYDNELLRLSGQVRSLMLRADRDTGRNPATRQQLYEELLQVSKRLHRLQEEAMATNNALQQSGQAPDRGLTFASCIAQTLDLAQSDTAAYLDTHDKSFQVAASGAANSALALMAAQ
ncbi:MAG: hypothetical protein ACYCZI_13125 [Metallibacterium scheffleri]